LEEHQVNHKEEEQQLLQRQCCSSQYVSLQFSFKKVGSKKRRKTAQTQFSSSQSDYTKR
jgi:hypothetical protein